MKNQNPGNDRWLSTRWADSKPSLADDLYRQSLNQFKAEGQQNPICPVVPVERAEDRMHDDSDLTDEPHDPTNRKPWIPSPEQIAASCREIQREWSDEERWKRAPHFLPSPIEVQKGRVHRLN